MPRKRHAPATAASQATATNSPPIRTQTATLADTATEAPAGQQSDSSPAAASNAAPTSDEAVSDRQQASQDATQTTQIDAGNADSHASTPKEPQPPSQAGKAAQQAQTQDAGNVSEATNGEAPSVAFSYARARERLQQLPEWPHIIGTVKEMRLDPKLAKMRAEYRERFIWGEMDRLYPPKAQFSAPLDSPKTSTDNDLQTSVPRNSGSVQGLGDIPPGWPELPANAALAAEVGWVQAERLRIVEERAGAATVVTLAKARAPAPSWSALSWLETSIRSYAKFVEVAAKVASAPGDEVEQHKRERMAIEEIRSLLAEMAGNPPGPGR